MSAMSAMYLRDLRYPFRKWKDTRAASRACRSVTFREFARSIYYHGQCKSPFRPAINDLDECIDDALRWHERCSKRGLTAPLHGVIPSRRKGEVTMMSTHGGAASASVAALARQEAVVLSPLLSRLVTATMVTALALCMFQPAHAQQRDASFVVPY